MKENFVFLERFISLILVHKIHTRIILLIIIVVSLPSCANKMALEEAKHITLKMSRISFTPPPRRIYDIIAILDQTVNFDPKFHLLASVHP